MSYTILPTAGARSLFIRIAILSIALFVIFFSYSTDVSAEEMSSEPITTPTESTPPASEPSAVEPVAPEPVILQAPELSPLTEETPTTEPALAEPAEAEAPKPALREMAIETMAGETAGIDESQSKLNVGNQIKVKEYQGAPHFTHAFVIPPGRGSTAPSLYLNYDSAAASDHDIAGYGWKLSIPFIERISRYGSDTMYDSTREIFVSPFDGELVLSSTTGKYLPKVEKGNFFTYERLTNGWKIADKNGLVYYFGTTDTSRLQSDDGTKIAGWYLDKVTDLSGNSTTYTFTRSGGLIRPQEISYTNSSSTKGVFAIKFFYAATTPFTSYTLGFPTSNTDKISRIETYANNAIVSKYDLRYSNGANEQRQLLSGIQRTGYRNPLIDVLPETTFFYESQTLPSWDANGTSVNFPEKTEGQDKGVRFGDLNGDGLVDIIRYYELVDMDGSVDQYFFSRRVHLNKGNGQWDIDVPWNWSDIHVPFSIFQDGVISNDSSVHDLGSRLADVNGDGRDDFIVSYGGTAVDGDYTPQLPDEQVGVYLNNGTGFVRDDTWTGLQTFVSWSAARRQFINNAFEVIDLNNDQLPELVQSYLFTTANTNVASNTVSRIFLNTGKNWVETDKWKLPVPIGNIADNRYGVRSFQDFGTRFVDVNGDSLIDVIRGYREDASASNPSVGVDESSAYLNTGVGWIKSPEWSPGYLIIPDYPTADLGYRFYDINNDKLVDMILSNCHNGCSQRILINTGRGWTTKLDYFDDDWDNLPAWMRSTLPIVFLTGYPGLNGGYYVGDVDGDTLIDSVDLNFDDSVSATSTGGTLYRNTSQIQDTLSSIKLETGGIVDITVDGYHSSSQFEYIGEEKSPVNPLVVTDVEYNPIIGDTTTVNYTYKNNGFWRDTSDIYNKRSTGFGEIAEKYADGTAVTTWYHQNDGLDSKENSDSYGRIMLPYRTETRDAGNKLFEVNTTAYGESIKGSTRNILTTSSIRRLYNGLSTSKDTKRTYTYDGVGNITAELESGFVNCADNGTCTTTGSPTRETTTTYWKNPAAYQYKPAKVTLKNTLGATERITTYTYNSRGDMLSTGRWIASTTYATTSYAYSLEGLTTSIRTPLGATTTITYDQYRLYPATTTNPLGQQTITTYDITTGNQTTITAPNKVINTYVYDTVGRLYLTLKTAANGPNITRKSLAYTTDTVPYAVETTLYNQLENTTVNTLYIDGFGREIQKKNQANVGFITYDTEYDSSGRVKRVSQPYQSTVGTYTTPQTNTNLRTTYVYDALNRIKSETNARGVTNTTYNGYSTTIADPLNRTKTFTYDAYNNLAQVEERLSTSTYKTLYTYNAAGNLTKLTDALGNIRNVAYDGLGRRTRLEDLHQPSDTNFGVWQFVYDAVHQTRQIDPSGVSTNYTYDKSSRMTSEDSTNTAGIDIKFVYDTCANGKGLLCQIAVPNATTSYAYLSDGTIGTHTQIIGPSSYVKTFTYDFQDREISVTYPGSRTVTTTYTKEGKPATVLLNGILFAKATYGPHGKPTKIEYGNNTISTYTYEPNRLYELKRKVTTMALGSKIQDLNYVYDKIGNIVTITDNSDTVTRKTVTYTYDNLYRLTAVKATSTANNQNYNESFTYNALGNIINRNGKVFTYTDTGVNNPHAATKVGSSTLNYSKNGNMLSDGTWNHTWDYRNRLVKSAHATNTTLITTYRYNYDNERITLIEGTETTNYPFTDYEITGTKPKLYLSLGDITVGELDSSTKRYIHTDHLGSVVQMTDDLNSTPTKTFDYFSFGNSRLETGTLKEKEGFTGYKKDYATGLNYAGARYYASTKGQFITQDPVFNAIGDWKLIQDKTQNKLGLYLQNPQTHNSYSYAANNPVRYQDQGGEYIESVIDVAFIAYDLYKVGEAVATGGDYKAQAKYLAADITGLALPGVTGLGLVGRIAAKTGDDIIQLQQVATKNNYRSVYEAINGKLSSSDIELHHTIPQVFRAQFAKAGVNIDAPDMLRAIHKNDHVNVTKEWSKWRKNNPDPTNRQVRNFAKQIENKYKNKYYKSKK